MKAAQTIPDTEKAEYPAIRAAERAILGQGERGSTVSSEKKRLKICVFDSDRESLEDIKQLLSAMGHEVMTIGQAIGASNKIRRYSPDILVADIIGPTISGLKFIEVLRNNLEDLPRMILFSRVSEDELSLLAKKAGAEDFVVKNGSYTELVNRIKLHASRMRN